jgi:Holliday junction resolvase
MTEPRNETTRYARGRDAEYRIRKELEAQGYQTIRTAGSHGWSDVIAWNENETRFIQSKTWSTKYKPSYTNERRKLEKIVLPPEATAELWIRKMRQKGWADQIVVQSTRTTSAEDPSQEPGSPSP